METVKLNIKLETTLFFMVCSIWFFCKISILFLKLLFSVKLSIHWKQHTIIFREMYQYLLTDLHNNPFQKMLANNISWL